MKVTFKCKVIYDDSTMERPTFKDIDRELLEYPQEFDFELLQPWSNDAEPTLIITRRKE